MSDNAYEGSRYLIDAENGRQYMVDFSSNGRKPKVDVFAADPRDAVFTPGETVYAFDDDIQYESVGSHIYLKTRIFEINANSAGEAYDINFSPEIRYDLNVSADGMSAKWRLTQDARALITGEGIDVLAVPDNIAIDLTDIADFDTKGRPVIDYNDLKLLPFPPHHAGGSAALARAGAKSSPRQAFNQVSNQRQRNKPVADYTQNDNALEGALKKYCVDLTEQAVDGMLDPVIGREAETSHALKILTRRKQSSLCFTGDSGVGKTAMFSAIAQRIVDDKGELPESLRNARVLQLDVQALTAGTKYRGDLEDRVKVLVKGLTEREGVFRGQKIILAIDELHAQLASGGASDANNLGNLLKPFFTCKGISVMGATTDAEYRKYIEADAAQVRRFERLYIGEPTTEATVAIIKKLWPLTRAHNSLAADLSDEDIRYIVTMTDRYAPQECQPSKAEKVMNTAAASAEFNHRDHVAREDIIAAVAQMSGLPVSFLNQSDDQRFLQLEQELPNEILGQPGVARVVDGLIGARSGLTDENQPRGCFVFQGPTGTGKTELCKALARKLFGSEDALIKLDMSEYAEKFAISRLIGAPPGYVGFDSAEPALTEKIRKRPYSILLLDEIEKAHPDVFNVLLPALNDGRMTDNQGKVALFNNVIVVMTTNAGAAAATALLQGEKKGITFGLPDVFNESASDMEEQIKKIYKEAVTKPQGPDKPALFRPEMINRIEELGGFIQFVPLAKSVVSTLVSREIDKVNVRLSSQAGANVKGLSIEVTDAVKAQLSDLGYDPAMGARPLRKVVREKISNRFGKWLLANRAAAEAFIAENGPAKIVIDNLDTFTGALVKATAIANDNAEKKAVAPRKKNSITPKK